MLPTPDDTLWNSRYDVNEYVYGTAPNDFLADHYHRIQGNKVLCLAEGEGRNAVFLAEKGYDVTAVDFSSAGIEKANKLAAQKNVHIHYIKADLAEYELGQHEWDGIVSIFCHLPSDARKRLHQQIPGALKRGGVLLLEAYTPNQLQFKTGGPQETDMMQSGQDLNQELEGLEFELLREIERDIHEGQFHTGRGAVVQLIAVNPYRTMRVSSNREAGVHKMRFVETGGGEPAGDCRMCEPGENPRTD